jgi:hypothetical protein
MNNFRIEYTWIPNLRTLAIAEDGAAACCMSRRDEKWLRIGRIIDLIHAPKSASA